MKQTDTSRCGALPPAPGSFVLHTQGTDKIALTAIDHAGLKSGAGRLLRELHMPGRGVRPTATSAVVSVPQDLCVQYDGSTALWPIRGHQISVDYHPLQLRTRPRPGRAVPAMPHSDPVTSSYSPWSGGRTASPGRCHQTRSPPRAVITTPRLQPRLPLRAAAAARRTWSRGQRTCNPHMLARFAASAPTAAGSTR